MKSLFSKKLVYVLVLLAVLTSVAFRVFSNEQSLGVDTAETAKTPVYIQVSAGNHYTVGLMEDGTVWTWGSNMYGELGDGTTIDSYVPIKVEGLTDVKYVTTASDSTLAIKKDGTVWGWGKNNHSQLGKDQPSEVLTPTKIEGIEKVKKIAANSEYAMALKEDGTVWVWGYDTAGYLGTGTTMYSTEPIKVPGIEGIKDIALGWFHAVLLKEDGTVWTWGSNSAGQLGIGTRETKTVPTKVPGLSDIKAVSASPEGFHTVALKEDGTVWAWGSNSARQLGSAVEDRSLVPVQVEGLDDIVQIDAGMYTTIAVGSNGELFMWGSDEIGYFKNSTVTNFYSPVKLDISYKVKEASTEKEHLMFLTEDNRVLGLGSNNRGQLGNGTNGRIGIPVPLTKLEGLKELKVGKHFIALKEDGTLWGWGENTYGQLGNGTTKDADSFTKVENIEGVIDFDVGSWHTVALKEDGTVWTWGSNGYCQIGQRTEENNHIPARVLDIDGVISVKAGTLFTMALKDDGTVWVWGSNLYGELGSGYVSGYSDTPVKVESLENVMAIEANGDSLFALKEDGTVWTWGRNMAAGLGDDVNGNNRVPVMISNLDNVKHITAGYTHMFAIKEDGSVWAWGSNLSGQFGNGIYEGALEPIEIEGIENAKKILAGNNCTVILEEDGTVFTCGVNYFGQLGDARNIDCSSVFTKAIGTNYKDIAVNYDSNIYGIKEDGTIYGFGQTVDLEQPTEVMDVSNTDLRLLILDNEFIYWVEDNDSDSLEIGKKAQYMELRTSHPHAVYEFTEVNKDSVIIEVTAADGVTKKEYKVEVELEVPVSRTAGDEYEQRVDLAEGTIRPEINYVNVEVIDSSKGHYRLTVEDYTIDPDGEEFFFWEAKEGVFTNVSNNVKTVEFIADKNTYGRRISVVVTIGDGLGYVGRYKLWLEGAEKQ